jgi:acyl carrier protein
MKPDFDEIVTRVSRCVAEVLAIEPDEVARDSRLMDSLGADSLDLVELMYLMEQEFDITLHKDDMSLTAQLGLSEEELHDNEVLTPGALELLRERFPASKAILVEGISRKHLAALITVEEVARSVERKLAACFG